ncbi:MAG: VWA domain-containing protein [Limnohabitans sp.]|nr:MAG: VWA domain-containing protein [Limnohabitans sp.]
MEEWVGQQWHRLITRAASRTHEHAAVDLPQMLRSIGMLFRAAGGGHGVRITPASDTRTGGPRDWLQRLAGSGTHAALGRVEAQALSLPPRIAVFDDAALNRTLYLWLAALGACHAHSGNWVSDNLQATRAVLQQFPGLASSHKRLLAQHLAQRPDPSRLRGAQAEAECQVRQALLGQTPAGSCALRPQDVAPVWLWLDANANVERAAARHDSDVPLQPAPTETPAQCVDNKRRRAQSLQDERDRAPLMLFFRAESILSWGEFTKVNRASDDDPDDGASRVADDLDTLAVAPDGQSTAARVKFDLDLPSAAADDRPLGPGETLPEWDWRRRQMLPEHCAAQTLVTQATQPFVPTPALRTTARRVQRRLEILRAGRGRMRGQTEGDEIDLDAFVRYQVEGHGASRCEAPPIYWRRTRNERSLATLLLADLSLSTDAYATPSARVIDVIRDALYVFGEALHASGDPFSMLGFSSVRRQHVRIQHLKGFDESWGATTRDRVGAIKPGYYTRMGAALRLATRRLQLRPERQRLLLILTDGKPNDLDVYEGRYGLEDTRQAVQEARAAGLTPLCITIDEAAHDYLPMLFGQNGYVLVHRPQDLVHRLAAIHAGFMRNSG